MIEVLPLTPFPPEIVGPERLFGHQLELPEQDTTMYSRNLFIVQKIYSRRRHFYDNLAASLAGQRDSGSGSVYCRLPLQEVFSS